MDSSGSKMDAFDDGWRRYGRFFIVFITYFAAVKGAQYLFYSLHTSPALLWPSVGIAFGFMLIWGYEQLIPLALAQICLAFTMPWSTLAAPGILVGIVAYPAQYFLGIYALKKLKFESSITRTRDVFAILGVAFVFTAIAPILISLASYWGDALQVPLWINWTRAWAGGGLSTIIITPFMTSWFSKTPNILEDSREINRVESTVGMIMAALITYILFWTAVGAENSFFFIYIFLAIFFWIGLRLQPRVMSLALIFTTIFAVMGSILTHSSSVPLATQLFSDELFMILIAPIFLVLTAIVTERRIAVYQLEKEKHELAIAMEKLSSQDKSRNDFITILAHELRNPLAPIASNLEYLHLREKDQENLRAIISAEKQIHIVRRLLDDLLDVNRMNQNKFTLQKEQVTLESVVCSAIEAVEAFFVSKNQHFSYYLPEETVIIKVDATRLTQAIMNLLFNAGKYSYPEATIHLVAEHTNEGISISIKDNGMGISPEALPIIFQPFQQAPRETPVGTGLGLGLFITKQLIEMHGGTITAQSEGINKGSTFTITLPPSVEIKKMSLSAKNSLSHLPPPSRALNILLVDDNKAAANALKNLLNLRGYSVSIAYDGKSGIEAMAASKPEVIILDIGLPDMNGNEIAREIRKQGNTSTLIALTGYGQEEDRLESKKSGFDYHLTKPIELFDIEKILGSI